MKIICTQAEKEWLEKLMAESDDCGLNCGCMYEDCRQCIEKNVNFIYENRKEIVTCKDCNNGFTVTDDFFCASGRRK